MNDVPSHSVVSSDNESYKNDCITEDYCEMDKNKDNSFNSLTKYDDLGSSMSLQKKNEFV